jgi:HAMP domain-containing protein
MPFLSSIWFKLGAAAVAIALIFAAYTSHVNGIKNQQKMEDTNKELIQAMADIKILQQKTEALDQAQSAMLIELNKKNAAVVTRQETIRTYLQSDDAKKSDRPSSDVIKETVRRLSNAQ